MRPRYQPFRFVVMRRFFRRSSCVCPVFRFTDHRLQRATTLTHLRSDGNRAVAVEGWSTPGGHSRLHIAAIQTARFDAQALKKRPLDWTCIIPPGGGSRCWSAFALFRVPRRTVIVPVMVAMLLPFVAVPIAVSVPVTVPVPSGRHYDHRCRCDHDGRARPNAGRDGFDRRDVMLDSSHKINLRF
jgi:hypothetical protein